MQRHFQRLVQPAVDAVAHPHATVGRFDVDVAGPLLDGVEDDVIHQSNDGRLAGDFFDVADVFDRLFDQGDFRVAGVLDDVVDDEHLRVGQRRQHPADIFAGGSDDLHFELRERADFLDQKQVRGLRDRQREHAANVEQRQHQVLLDVVSRQDVDHARIVEPRFELGIRNAVFGGQAFDHLVFGT